MPPRVSPPQPGDTHPTEPLLEASLVQSKQIGDETNSLLEAIVHQNDANNPEPLLGAQIVQNKQNTDRIIEALKPPMQVSDKAKAFFDLMKGDQGEKGDTGDKGEQGDQGDKGDTGPQGPQGISGAQGLDGLNGADGAPGKDGQDGIDGTDGAKGPKGDPGKAGSADTPEQIRIKLASLKEPWLDPSAIKGSKETGKNNGLASPQPHQHGSMQTYRVDGVLVSNGGVVNFKTGSGVTLTGVQTKDGIDITIAASGGGGTFENPAETPDDSRLTYTVLHEPRYIIMNGMTYTVGKGAYVSYIAGTVTLNTPVGTGGFILSAY